MRRIKMIMGIAAVLVGMLTLTAGPAMANEFDFENHFDDEVFVVDNFGDDEEVVFLDEDEGLFDALCSPGIDIDLAGCIFSDEEDVDFLDEDEFHFVLADDGDFFDDDEVDFRFVDDDDDDNDDDENNNNDNERSFTRIIDGG